MWSIERGLEISKTLIKIRWKIKYDCLKLDWPLIYHFLLSDRGNSVPIMRKNENVNMTSIIL